MPLILAIETSAHIGAVALCGNGVALAESAYDGETKLSGWVLPAIGRLMQRRQCTGVDIDAIAWGAGPGAFTGVRTACATAQALAYAWGRPLVTVDSLAALAEASGVASVTVVLDARMNEVYTASFRRDAGGELRAERAIRLCAPTDVDVAGTDVLIGSGAQLVVRSAVFDNALAAHAESHWAEGLACIATRKLARGETTDPQRAEPLYVRNKVALTEAERASARRSSTAVDMA